MPGRTGKVTATKNSTRQLSPEIPSPVKINEANLIDDDDIENRMPIDQIESKDDSPQPIESKTDLNPMAILLANGQPLLTNFEEKYLIDLILKTSNKDLETILQDKIHFILQMNYGSQSSLFTLNSSWIFDFILKHFQSLIEHNNSSELIDKFLQKKFDPNNSMIAFKHWQLQTLVNEQTKKSQQSSIAKKRRMTVRHIDLK